MVRRQRHWGIALVFNKGLAGAPAAAIETALNTAMNPDVLDAFALAITADAGPPTFSGLAAPDFATARARRSRVQAAMAALRAAAPETGAYVNECDYFQADWQKAFWGPNYSRLARIKRRYDPDGRSPRGRQRSLEPRRFHKTSTITPKGHQDP